MILPLATPRDKITQVPFTRSSAKRAILTFEVTQLSLTAVFASWVLLLAESFACSILFSTLSLVSPGYLPAVMNSLTRKT
jgi:hypothetical protein